VIDGGAHDLATGGVRVAEQAAQGLAEVGREAVGQRARAGDGAALSRSATRSASCLPSPAAATPARRPATNGGDDARGLEELAHGGGEDGVDEDLRERRMRAAVRPGGGRGSSVTGAVDTGGIHSRVGRGEIRWRGSAVAGLPGPKLTALRA
jgi:hypothetical protein